MVAEGKTERGLDMCGKYDKNVSVFSRDPLPAALQTQGHVLLGTSQGHINGRDAVYHRKQTYVHLRAL